jgi:hypothetical protein
MNFADCVASKATPLFQGEAPADLPSLLRALGEAMKNQAPR